MVSPIQPAIEDVASMTMYQEPHTTLKEFPFFPFLPINIQEHIVSFVDTPQRLRRVCRCFREVIVPIAIPLQIQRLKEYPPALKALQLAEIIDLSIYTEREIYGDAEQLQFTIANQLEDFFTRVGSSSPLPLIFDIIANPEILADRIYTAYFSQIIDILFVLSPSISVAGEFAIHLLKQKNTELAVSSALDWAQDVHDLCACNAIPTFTVTVTDGTYESPQHTWLPRMFLRRLSPIPITIFGVLVMVKSG
jgi:hypothetical protein